jgi:hypothetical protein
MWHLADQGQGLERRPAPAPPACGRHLRRRPRLGPIVLPATGSNPDRRTPRSCPPHSAGITSLRTCLPPARTPRRLAVRCRGPMTTPSTRGVDGLGSSSPVDSNGDSNRRGQSRTFPCPEPPHVRTRRRPRTPRDGQRLATDQKVGVRVPPSALTSHRESPAQRAASPSDMQSSGVGEVGGK